MLTTCNPSSIKPSSAPFAPTSSRADERPAVTLHPIPGLLQYLKPSHVQLEVAVRYHEVGGSGVRSKNTLNKNPSQSFKSYQIVLYK